MGGTCVCTGFDRGDWDRYGASFLGSLFETGFTGAVLVTQHGLPMRALMTLKQNGVRVVPSGPSGLDRLLAVAKYAETEQDYDYAFWAPDTYFRSDPAGACGVKIGYCIRPDYPKAVPDPGFVSAPPGLWGVLRRFLSFAAPLDGLDGAFGAFVEHFSTLVEERPVAWNSFSGADALAVRQCRGGESLSFRRLHKGVYEYYHGLLVMGHRTTARGVLKASMKPARRNRG